MATLFLPRHQIESRCRENDTNESELSLCITRRVSAGVFVDTSVAPAWLIEPHRRGLGDMTADALAAVGITKERVSRALGRPCKCPERQAWLNRVGRILGIG
jgi:hypothetical protein